MIPIYKNYPTVPKSNRDINLIFNRKYTISEILNHIRKSGKKIMENVSLIDIYTDESLGLNNVSYTFRLSYRNPDKTLTEVEITEVHENIIKSIENKFSAKLKK